MLITDRYHKKQSLLIKKVQSIINPNLTTGFTGLVGKVGEKKTISRRRRGGEKKRGQRARRARGSNLGPAAC